MKHILLLVASAIPSILHAGSPPERDRAAILAMAGAFEVSFEFRETVAIAPGYAVNPEPYAASAVELIKVVEDTPHRITLQNILVHDNGDDGPQVIKHWAQVWTWQDTGLLDYAGEDGDHFWKRIRLSESEARGTWSQLVMQVDDTPRYEGTGRWVHENGESYWQSEPSRRPLPRREHTKRDDYDYILATNRQSITANGWVHLQDNRKVVDRDDAEPFVLCHEFGVNEYRRIDFPQTAAAVEWWEKHGSYWNTVREFWVDAAERAPNGLAYHNRTENGRLREVLRRMQEEKPAADKVRETLSPFLIVR